MLDSRYKNCLKCSKSLQYDWLVIQNRRGISFGTYRKTNPNPTPTLPQRVEDTQHCNIKKLWSRLEIEPLSRQVDKPGFISFFAVVFQIGLKYKLR